MVSYAELKAQYDEFGDMLSPEERYQLEQELEFVASLEAQQRAAAAEQQQAAYTPAGWDAHYPGAPPGPAGPSRGTVDDVFRMLEPMLLRHQDLFHQLDENGDGDVSADELHAAFRQRGADVSRRDVRALFAVLDQNSDGRVEINEFVEMMRKMKNVRRSGRSLDEAIRKPARRDSNMNRRRFPALAAVHSSTSMPELGPRSANMSAAAIASVSRHSPAPFRPGRDSSVVGELASFTDVWAAKEGEAERQRRGALSQVRHAVLHKSTHVDLAPAVERSDSAEARRLRQRRRLRGNGVGMVNGKRQVFSPANPAAARNDITLRGSIVAGNAMSEFDAEKDLDFARAQESRRNWVAGIDMVPADGKPTDTHNPLTLMSADMPTLLYEKLSTAERSRHNREHLNASYASRTASLKSFTEVGEGSKSMGKMQAGR